MKEKNAKMIIFAVILWILTLLWTCFIYKMSAENSEESTQTSGKTIETVARIFIKDYDELSEEEREAIIEKLSFPIRKLAHFTEYAILGFLFYSSLTVTFYTKRKPVLYPVISALFSFIYAAADEFHQGFVPGRAPAFTDVMIDTSGALVGITILNLIMILLIKHRNKRKNQREK